MLNSLLALFGVTIVSHDVVRENGVLLRHNALLKERARLAERERELYRIDSNFHRARLEDQAILRMKLARYEASEPRIESCVSAKPWLDEDMPRETMQ